MNAPTSQIVRAGGVDCFLWTWLSPAEGGASKGLVLLFHGLGAHARFPSVRVAAEALASGGFTVCAPDFAGHGVSGGQRGFIHSAEWLESDALLFVEAAQRAHPQLPLFLAGSSMGGAIAFQAALALGDEVRGLVLLAPMLAPAASAPAQALVTVLSYTPLSRLPLIPSVRVSSTLTLTLILTRTRTRTRTLTLTLTPVCHEQREAVRVRRRAAGGGAGRLRVQGQAARLLGRRAARSRRAVRGRTLVRLRVTVGLG